MICVALVIMTWTVCTNSVCICPLSAVYCIYTSCSSCCSLKFTHLSTCGGPSHVLVSICIITAEQPQNDHMCCPGKTDSCVTVCHAIKIHIHIQLLKWPVGEWESDPDVKETKWMIQFHPPLSWELMGIECFYISWRNATFRKIISVWRKSHILVIWGQLLMKLLQVLTKNKTWEVISYYISSREEHGSSWQSIL